jgi:hypothetical protein
MACLILLIVFSAILITLNPRGKFLVYRNDTTGTSEQYGYVLVESQSICDSNFGQNSLVLHRLFCTGSDKSTSKSASKRCKQETWRRTDGHTMVALLLLLLAGDVSVNPGPRRAAYPCGSCGYAVKKQGQRAIFCERCCLWVHLKCLPNMTVSTYNKLSKDENHYGL